MLSKENIKEIFDYKDGNLIWKISKSKQGAKAGEVAANINSWRPTVRVCDKTYRSHRLIWIMFNGDIPEGFELDHIDYNKSNNKIENLRIATRQQNLFNRPVFSKTKSGIKGVSFSGKKWVAQIRDNKKIMYLGSFETKEEAGLAYKTKAMELHREFARF